MSRISSKFPADPNKFAEIVSEFLNIKRLTPRKKAALQSRGLDRASLECRKLQFAKDAGRKALQNSIRKLKQQTKR